MFRSCRSLAAIAIFVALTLMSGCGRKTALIPPQKLAPVAISDLSYLLDESGVTLKWTYPVKTENGDELLAIEGFEVSRAEVAEEDYCMGCPVQFEKHDLVSGGDLPVTGESRTAIYKETDLRVGHRYLYKVRSQAGWWYPSSYSNVVTFAWRSPPDAPRGLKAEAGDRTLTLSWEPVKENIVGDPLGQNPMYQVYRKKSDEDRFIALGKPIEGLKFIDTGLNNDMLYSYRVRALVTFADTLQSGGASQEISSKPRDLTAPAQPRHLAAVVTPAGVKLVWQAISNDDLAGYRIYRRPEKSAEPELIAEVGADQNQYVDQGMTTVGKWFYSVTSFDKAQPPNESLPATETDVDFQ